MCMPKVKHYVKSITVNIIWSEPFSSRDLVICIILAETERFEKLHNLYVPDNMACSLDLVQTKTSLSDK